MAADGKDYKSWTSYSSYEVNAGAGSISMSVKPSSSNSSRTVKFFISTVKSEVTGAFFGTTSLSHGYVSSDSTASSSGLYSAYFSGLSEGTKYYWQIMSNTGTNTVYVLPAAGVAGEETTSSSTPLTTYTLTFSANGGTAGSTTRLTTSQYTTSWGFTIPTTAVPSRSGYKFLGWSKSSSATSATYNVGDTVTLYSSSPSLYIYAVWQEESYFKADTTEWTYRVANKTSRSFDVIVENMTSGIDRRFRGYHTTTANAATPAAWANTYSTANSSTGSSVTLTFAGLQPETTYYFFIQGRGASVYRCFCLPNTTTWASTTTLAEYATDSADIAQFNASYNSFGVSIYNITSRSYERTLYCVVNGVPKSETIRANETTKSFIFTGLASNKEYSVEAYLLAPNGDRTWGRTTSMSTLGYGADSGTLSVSSNNSTSLTLTLNNITSRTYSRTVKFVCGTEDHSVIIDADDTSANYTFTGLTAGSSYAVSAIIYAPDMNPTCTRSKTGYTQFGFSWSKTIAKGQPITNLTYSDWNRYTSCLKTKASRRSVSCPTFTTVSSGDTLTSTIFNQAATALYYDYNLYVVSKVTAGDPVSASYFSNLVTYLNTDDN